MTIRSDIDYTVLKIQKDIHSKNFEEFIESSKPFIISTVSKKLGRYVNIENDDGYEIALLAFYNAIVKYKFDKGTFLSFAKVLIDNQLINYLKKANRDKQSSLEDVDIENIKDTSTGEIELKMEIQAFEGELSKFGIDFDTLVVNSPKHYDTREEARIIARKTSKEEDLVKHLFKKKRLPVTEMSKRFSVSRKVIYGSKEYIISIIIIIIKKFDLIKTWIK